jgi:hypothetical protein
MSDKERRTERRYSCQQPAFLRTQSGDGIELEAVTENVSTHGLLLRCKTPIDLGSKVKIKLHFPTSVILESVGKILRVEPRFKEDTVVAVRCEAPLEISRRPEWAVR